MTYANEGTATGQALHAHNAYMTGATGLPVQDDLDARVAVAAEEVVSLTNAELATDLLTTTASHPWGDVTTYAGGNIVAFAGETTVTNVEAIVVDAMENDRLFTTGPDPDGNFVDAGSSLMSEPTYLIEASKLTGRKFF